MIRPTVPSIVSSIASGLLLIASVGALGAQQPSTSNPYEGTSNPPADDAIITSAPPRAKPSASTPAAVPVDPAANAAPAGNSALTGASDAPPMAAAQPTLEERVYASDPDGDMVQPRALRPGELAEGTVIRVELLDRLSTAASEKGEAFRTRVASDVVQGGQVSIPAGAEIDGTVVEVSSGHLGGHGSMRLRPETVILLDGSRFRLHAEVTGAPGSKTRVGTEGAINPGSRVKRDGIEYGGAVGAGVTTGAILGGPVGAVTGGLIGAGVVTAHLLVNHPQATIETGSTLLFTLTEPLYLVAVGTSGN